MKKLLGVSLLALTTMFGSNAAEAVSADGEARINMIQALTLTQTQSINYGDTAVDGAGTVNMAHSSGAITCSGFNSHSCPATGTTGAFSVSGKSNTSVAVSVTSNATMSHSDSSTLTFIPSLSSTSVTLDGSGAGNISVGGAVALTGTESAGEYSTTNSGGVPYQINVVY
ncbi:MAG: DUF4402 domain-containing protein [Alphaproteobacteria bacterium]|nr:MAG: hypothetical protein B6I23_02860 [Rickettsiaceae bacterium 4572_127]